MKFIFIDIDGTLVDTDGKVPASAAKAICNARSKGNLVFINTGRSRAQVFKNIEDIGFDGFICSDGCYVEYKGQVIKKESLSKNQIDIIKNYAKNKNLGFMIEGHKSFLINKRFQEVMSTAFGDKGFERFSLVFPFSAVVDEVPYEDVGKVNFPVQSDCTIEVQKAIGPKLEAGYFSSGYDDYGMIFLRSPGCDKLNGIKFLLQYLQLNDAETYAFGDSDGDLGMVTGCTHGIAMGNGEDALKSKAEYITTSVTENGLYNAFIKFNLI